MESNHASGDPIASRGTTNPADADPLTRLERRLMETLDDLWDNFVDPAEALYDVDGSRWSLLGSETSAGGAAGAAFTTEDQLREIRLQCRALAVTNEFAINGHENRFRKPTFSVSGRFRAVALRQGAGGTSGDVRGRTYSRPSGGRAVGLFAAKRQPTDADCTRQGAGRTRAATGMAHRTFG